METPEPPDTPAAAHRPVRLKEVLALRQISQEQVSADTDLNAKTVWRALNGFPAHRLTKRVLAEYAGLDVEDAFGPTYADTLSELGI